MENNPHYVKMAIEAGFNVEVDVWQTGEGVFLGHDEPQYPISVEFLLKNEIWCHAKNIEALVELHNIGAHYFWHQEDDVTLTSNNHIWTYPGATLTKNSICVMPERYNPPVEELVGIAGICSDYVRNYSYLKK
jgi:hypothetical protein